MASMIGGSGPFIGIGVWGSFWVERRHVWSLYDHIGHSSRAWNVGMEPWMEIILRLSMARFMYAGSPIWVN